jgi:hypothetical protein
MTMSSTLTQPIPQIQRRRIRRRLEVEPQTVIAAVFYLAVLIATGVAVVLAARSIPDIASIYVAVT